MTKEQKLVAAIITVNNLCAELQLPELLPMAACRIILDASRERGVEQLRGFALQMMKAASNLVQ